MARSKGKLRIVMPTSPKPYTFRPEAPSPKPEAFPTPYTLNPKPEIQRLEWRMGVLQVKASKRVGLADVPEPGTLALNWFRV